MTTESKPTENEVRTALDMIVANSNDKGVNYAVNYAKAGCSMRGKELRIQCLYVLNNITHWRGDLAKSIRSILKDFTKKQR
jgi:hypothetical protein